MQKVKYGAITWNPKAEDEETGGLLRSDGQPAYSRVTDQ